MDMERVFRKPKLLRTLTSLDAGEFERLLAAFEVAWQAQRTERNHAGQTRQRAVGAGHPGTLPTAQAKLFFVLFYFKCYPLQEVIAVLFGLSQGQVSHWVGVLTPLVNAALGRELLLPARRPADLERLLADVPELRLLILDGSERPIRRPKNKQSRKDDYSGKKKAHRKKNLLLSSHQRQIVYLGPTSAGSVHDKKLADESDLRLPPDALALQEHRLPRLLLDGGAHAPAHQETAGTRALPLAKNDQQAHQYRARGRGARHRWGQKVPHRRRHLPVLAARAGR